MTAPTAPAPPALYRDILAATTPTLPAAARDRVAHLWITATPRTRASVLLALAWTGRTAPTTPPVAALAARAVDTALSWHGEAARTTWAAWHGHPADADAGDRYLYDPPATRAARQAVNLATDPAAAALAVDTALMLAALVHHAAPSPRGPRYLYLTGMIPTDPDGRDDWE